MKRISDDVRNILDRCVINGNVLYLPDEQLDRKLYMAVNKVLEACGGKWNRKQKGHVFANDPLNVIEEIMQTGTYIDAKSEYQFFETPESLAKQLVEMAELKSGESVLEPSAGKASIAKYIRNKDVKLSVVELNPENRQYLIDDGYDLVGDDFLNYNVVCDVVIANPPFTKQQDIDHATHMISLARRKVVCVMSQGVLFRENNKTKRFRELVARYDGEFIPLPEGTFKSSGTMVNACILVIEK